MAEESMHCTICGSHKSLHTHQQHQWTNEEDPDVVPVPGAKMGSQDRTKPPVRRENPELAQLVSVRTTVRLIEVLTVKGLLTPEELFFIFGGKPDADPSTDRNADAETGEYRPAGSSA